MENNLNLLADTIRTLAVQLGSSLAEADSYGQDFSEAVIESLRIGVMSDDPNRKDAALGSMWTLAGLAGAISTIQFGTVETARINGASWDEIGRALGISRQAAQQRYGR